MNASVANSKLDLEKRPLEAEGLVGRTLHLYRRRFLLFFGISILPALLKFVQHISYPNAPDIFDPDFFFEKLYQLRHGDFSVLTLDWILRQCFHF